MEKQQIAYFLGKGGIKAVKEIKELDKIIIGRVEPHIYAFITETIPNYLKVGDTYRSVNVRLEEWKAYFPNLIHIYDTVAKVDNDVYFRDFAVHQFLENDKKKKRLKKEDIPSDCYYSREFFSDSSSEDVKEAIKDITTDYVLSTGKYTFYNADSKLPETLTFERTENYEPRPIQKQTIDNIVNAVNKGRNNLLMYAVMRFGKSFTSMCAAVELKAKLVVIVSAKADVEREWQKTIQSHAYFSEYVFLNSKALRDDNNIIHRTIKDNKKVAIFLTLQDLSGTGIKEKHKELFGSVIDLVIVDETHFGARADKYGMVLTNLSKEELKAAKHPKDKDDFIDVTEADSVIEKSLNAKTKLHLSGTPYRILMGSEFTKDDIVAFYQFTDIAREQAKWDSEHALDDDVKEWDNPYYGFPQMIRFAFNPNKSCRERLQELRERGVSFAFSALLKPKSIKKDPEEKYKEFEYSSEVLDLLSVIDGSKKDDEVLVFLNYDKIKEGNMCRHIVMVLPYCASCDAMEKLINDNKDSFKNLNEYEIINISGLDTPKTLNTPQKIKSCISKNENDGKKTITLTVNRMLTGSTVEEWDTMLYLKDTASPQEYDQAIYRLQNQYIKKYLDDDGNIIKYNMKPQTLLVDFMPARMFYMQEQKSQIYNVNVDKAGNSKLDERIKEELRISPIIVMNHEKMGMVESVDILNAVSEYSKSRGVAEETLDIPVDLSLLNIDMIKTAIEKENEIGSKSGFTIKGSTGDETDIDIPDPDPESNSNSDNDENEAGNSTGPDEGNKSADKANQSKDPVKQMRSYYARILFFAFLTKDRVISLEDIISKIDSADNLRIAKHVGISKSVLKCMLQNMNKFDLSKLDYKIHNLSKLSNDDSVDPYERASVAVRKFGKLGESEVITPSSICDKMICLIPNNIFIDMTKNGHKILDISGKAGEFALSIYKKASEAGVPYDIIQNLIYTIPTSGITYEFTRLVYEILNLNTDNISERLFAYDLFDSNRTTGKPDFPLLCSILTQNKRFSNISIYDEINEGDEKMKFDVVIGNPPYQENVSSSKDNDSLGKQLFPSFIELSFNLAEKYCSLITPSRWFTGDAQDKSFLKLRAFLRENNYIEKMFIYPTTDDVFKGVVIKGGVNFFLANKNHSGNVEFHTFKGGIETVEKRALFEAGYDIVFRSQIEKLIVQKAIGGGKESLFSITTGRNAFGIIGKPDSLKKQTSSVKNKSSVVVHCKNGEIRYIDKDKVNKNPEIMNNYKVFISKSAGDPDTDTKVIGVPFVGEKNTVCTDTFFPIGCFSSPEEAENLCKYIKTKFVRFLVNVLKSSQNVTQIVYRFVPMQDFTNNSDINWSESIDSISSQLYSKYGLLDDEIDIIETQISSIE